MIFIDLTQVIGKVTPVVVRVVNLTLIKGFTYCLVPRQGIRRAIQDFPVTGTAGSGVKYGVAAEAWFYLPR